MLELVIAPMGASGDKIATFTLASTGSAVTLTLHRAPPAKELVAALNTLEPQASRISDVYAYNNQAGTDQEFFDERELLVASGDKISDSLDRKLRTLFARNDRALGIVIPLTAINGVGTSANIRYPFAPGRAAADEAIALALNPPSKILSQKITVATVPVILPALKNRKMILFQNTKDIWLEFGGYGANSAKSLYLPGGAIINFDMSDEIPISAIAADPANPSEIFVMQMGV